MNTPTVTASATVANGKATIVLTTTQTNPDGSTTETTNTSVAMTKAQTVQLQSALSNQAAQLTAQSALVASKLAAVTTALADTSLV